MLPGLGSVSGGKGGVSNKSSAATGDTMTGDTRQGGGIELTMGGGATGAVPWNLVIVAAAGIAAAVIWKK